MTHVADRHFSVAVERMHYFPAAFIGGFANPSSAKRLRARPLWVARRDAPAAFLSTGDKVGFSPRDPRVYTTVDTSDGAEIEAVWAHAEGDNTRFHALLKLAARHGGMPAAQFALVIAPFVATLLARHPTLVLDGKLSRLDSVSKGQGAAVRARLDAFRRYADALTYSRRWMLVRSPSVVTTTDIGWLWLPGGAPGTLFVPVEPGLALIIVRDVPSYAHNQEWVSFDILDINSELVEMYVDAMTLQAPTAVFGPTRASVERAFNIWNRPVTVYDPERPQLSAQELSVAPSYAAAWMLGDGAPEDARLAWYRFLVAQHRFNCVCNASLLDRHINREDRRRILKHRTQILRLAEKDVLRRLGEAQTFGTVGTVLHRQDCNDGGAPLLSILGATRPNSIPLFKSSACAPPTSWAWSGSPTGRRHSRERRPARIAGAGPRRRTITWTSVVSELPASS